MNQKQKLGYMVLGAWIMAVGITIGQFITPNIEAQSNGVFNEITCRRLKVVDELGKDAILLDSNENVNRIIVFNKAGEASIAIRAFENGNSLLVKRNGGASAVTLMGAKDTLGVFITDDSITPQIQMKVTEDANMILVGGKAGEEGIGLLSDEKLGSSIMITDRVGNTVWASPEQEE